MIAKVSGGRLEGQGLEQKEKRTHGHGQSMIIICGVAEGCTRELNLLSYCKILL